MSPLRPARHRYIFSSLTRIADLDEETLSVEEQPRDTWSRGDYVVGRVVDASGYSEIELPNGRNMEIAVGDRVVGAFGTRYATLEMTGRWEAIGDDRIMHALTRAGLFGRAESRSSLVDRPIELRYQGHVMQDGAPATMQDAVPSVAEQSFDVPTVLFVGTSMSAGKTTAARIVTRRLAAMGLDVLGAKLSGAGRYRDVLSIQDAGAAWGFDFVDAGLPSTVVSEEDYRPAVRHLLSQMAEPEADAAVVEIGASPLEPYNGRLAIEALGDAIDVTILCASDPYAVLGVQKAFGMLEPDLVTGIATNTAAGVALLDELTDREAFNLRDPRTHDRLDALLREGLTLRA